MLAKCLSNTVIGINSRDVDVEVDISNGIRSFTIVGLPDTACRESAKRVMAAIKNSGFEISCSKITVNLAPAYLRKEGAIFDLAIAVAILAAENRISRDLLDKRIFCGELSLDGTLKPVKGVLCIVDGLKQKPDKELILPCQNMSEASAIKQVRLMPVSSLNEVIDYLKNNNPPQRINYLFKERQLENTQYLDFSDIKGNFHAKRAMEIAVAGGHNILLIGPPGGGKTMLAQRIPTIMGYLSDEQSIQTSKIYSICGLLKDKHLIKTPPFRALHHCASDAGLLGGGSNNIAPGEISLAHNGVLFLDELPEFRRDVLEALRQPLEEKVIRITRAGKSITYPCNFMLVAAMNPCPCGFLTHPKKACICTPYQVHRYLSKISGPLLDRIDMHVEISPIEYEQLSSKSKAETSAIIKQRIDLAKAAQKTRYADSETMLNAMLSYKDLEAICELTQEASNMLKEAMHELFVSARGYTKILKVARTIADLNEKPIIGAEEIAEAISYRSLDTRAWL
jgi:magnesium chelatase family protein